MLTKLSIQNYALIHQLEIPFSNGLSIITGETGAGKSILLGALGLVLGSRADSSTLQNTSKKCVVEAVFDIYAYNLQEIFEATDLDYEPHTIVRREILPSGKSRAFVNDTPVNLSVLHSLKQQLIDVHAQHQTLALSDTNFQFSLIDALANNQAKIASYTRGLQRYQALQKEHIVLLQKQQEANKQYDYNLHLFNELEEANLQAEEQFTLEEKVDKLTNIEDIKLYLANSLQVTDSEELGVKNLMHTMQSNLHKMSSFSKEYTSLYERVTAIKIELDDIISELERANETVDFNPNELEVVHDRLQIIYKLQKKHGVDSIEALQEIHSVLSETVSQVENAQENIDKKQQEITDVSKKLDVLADKISAARGAMIPKLTKKLEKLVADLGMENARFLIKLEPNTNYLSNGKDNLVFLFSANKGGHFGELKKVASGGELSRIMLAVKKILSENTQLPTIIFDEIDTGVSGEISNKMATIMQQMSAQMQVITITHLPQIAAKGTSHYKVFKEEINGVTTTSLKQLSKEERVIEIAEMLSGKNISDSAIKHAKELLN